MLEWLSPESLGRLELMLRITPERPELVREQGRALARQLPLLYAILSVNSLLLGVSFIGKAPDLLSIHLPLLFCVLCASRGGNWWRMRRQAPPELAQVVKLLHATVGFCIVLGLIFSAWALSLATYGDGLGKAHVAFYMSITVIGCIFCLTHVPAAALCLTLSVMTPFFGAFLYNGGLDLQLIAINAALVFCTLFMVLLNYYMDFTKLIQSRVDILAKQVEADHLHAENIRLANLDSLTGLPNRRLFFEGLERRLGSESGGIAVALVDLDGFKPVNDVYGHASGDQVLIQAAERLRDHAPEGAVARLGGDEFAILLDGHVDDAALLAWGAQVCQALNLPYAVVGSTARLSGSIGLSAMGEAGVTAAQLLERADYALYSAKKTHPGAPAIFSVEHKQELKRFATVGQALRDGVLAQELSVAFQPIIDTHTHRTTAFEALARWNSPLLGAVSPQEFIAVAESLGIVSQLTAVLLDKTLAEVAGWPAPFRVSFNLSTHDLISADAMEAVVHKVTASGVDPARIDFEVTETAVMSDFAKAVEGIGRLKALGCGISLDDFGTGHSSLSYVHRLPLDKIKIDRSFVVDLETNPAAMGIVKTVLDMSRNLKIACIVEGVETEPQLLRLRQLGCRHVQGYLFSRPLTAGDALRHIEDELATLHWRGAPLPPATTARKTSRRS